LSIGKPSEAEKVQCDTAQTETVFDVSSQIAATLIFSNLPSAIFIFSATLNLIILLIGFSIGNCIDPLAPLYTGNSCLNVSIPRVQW